SLEKGRSLLLIDFMGVSNREQANERIQLALTRMAGQKGPVKRVLEKLGELNEIRLGPFGFKGLNTVSASPPTLSQLLAAIEEISQSKKIAVFMDEIQDLLDMDDGEAYLSEMRGAIQHQEALAYVFAGSNRERMHRVFDHSKSPFFKQVIDIDLGPIPLERFSAWLAERFREGERLVADGVLERAYALCRGIPGDLQRVCYEMWELSGKGGTVELETLISSLKLILDSRNDMYLIGYRAVVKSQQSVLLGVACVGGNKVKGKGFADLVGLASGTVKRAVDALEARGELLKTLEGEYVFSDPFYRLWVMRLNPYATLKRNPNQPDLQIVSRLV
ncbi:MAG: hypothetical protein AAGB46_14430, partial [Verrucomicrobiota bacterium]